MEIYKLILERRSQLTLLLLCTTAVVVVLWHMLILPQQDTLRALEVELSKAQDSAEATRRLVRSLDQHRANQQVVMQRLRTVEQHFAQGDVYRWIINTALTFQEPYGVEFGEFVQPQIGELNVPPKVPYRAATASIAGTATYHDFGKFLAAFENEFPQLRLQRLELEPASQILTDPSEIGKLNFRVEFTVLVKSPGAGR